MIPERYITEWSEQAPWVVNKFIEQDLIVCRALVSIYSDAFLAKHLAFRGGTALGKLYLLTNFSVQNQIPMKVCYLPLVEGLKYMFSPKLPAFVWSLHVHILQLSGLTHDLKYLLYSRSLIFA